MSTGGLDTSARPERLPLLDALRTVAALGILLYHAPDVFGVPLLFSRAYLFVDLFFLLSGFVLTLSAEPRMSRGMTAATFMAARLRRVWPMMALGTLLAAAVFATMASPGEILPLTVLGLLQVPLLSGKSFVYPLNGPQWSVTWELLANLAHGLLLWRLSDRMLLALTAVSGVALIAAGIYGGCVCYGANVELWWLAAPRIAWSYMLGIWLARKWRATRWRPLADWRVALILPVGAMTLLPWLPLPYAAGDVLIVIAVLPPLFWLACTAAPPARVRPALEWVGSLSFPLYALHASVLKAFDLTEQSAHSHRMAVVAALAVAALVAWIVSRLKVAGTRASRGACPTPSPRSQNPSPSFPR